MEFKDKVVVVTGAGSGIGRELAWQLAARGAILVLNDLREDTLEETWQELPPRCRGLRRAFDVSKREEVEAFAQLVADDLGGVDVVINNAGFSLRQKPVAQSSVEDFERTLAVNLWGVIYGSLAFLPHLLRRGREASLVNISSVFGLFAFPGSGPYNTSKFAVRGFTESLRVELKDRLHVCCVHPGGIKTNIHNYVEMEEGPERDRFLRNFEKQARTTAFDAAHAIIRGIEKRKRRVLIGNDARFIDIVARLLPGRYEEVLLRWVDPSNFY